MTDHFHSCPYCYNDWFCTYGCTIEPDLEDRGRDFGSHHVCHDISCHIDRAVEKYNTRLEGRRQETIKRLRSPPQDDAEKVAKLIVQGLSRRPIA